MCGIVGCVGAENAAALMIEGLKKLEYRGYDSSGIAVFTKDGIRVEKKQGRIAALEEKLTADGYPKGTLGIGHTRWATHGVPSDVNAHPHTCGRVTLVHNGIIENDYELREELEREGAVFLSETDTEVAAHLLDRFYTPGHPVEAIAAAMKRLRGTFALAILFSDDPEHLYGVRKDSPLIVGIGEGTYYLASDVPAILNRIGRYYLPEDREIAVLSGKGVSFLLPDGSPAPEKEPLTADWSVDAAEKGGYPHFMLKEIMEQPETLRSAIGPRCAHGVGGILKKELPDVSGIERILIVACGSAMHAGMVGKHAIESLARIPTEVCIASEFRYRDPILRKGDVVIVVSQSGETADSLAALRLAKGKGIPVWAIVNVVGSSIAREADRVIYLYVGPEIAVATTKAYTAQVALLDLLAIRLAYERKTVTEERAERLFGAMNRLPETVRLVLGQTDRIRNLAKFNREAEHSFFIGRGQDYAVCCEGSLKLKEISYQHSEAYAAGELKHGTISLITPGTPVVAVATTAALLEKTVSNAKEAGSRGARILLLTRKSLKPRDSFYRDLLLLPDEEELLMPVIAIVPLQYYAYCTAVERGCDVDKPRNLAKSVTVE